MASVDIKGDAPADSDAFWPAAQLQLWAAAEKGDREGVERAMAAQEQDDAECTARANRMGWTALHRAAMGGSAECVEMLLAVPACAKLIDAKDNSGCAALHIACGLGHAAVVRALLVAGASAKAVTTEEARTPMHFACQGLSTSDEPSGHTVVILMLLAAGGLIEAADSNGILAVTAMDKVTGAQANAEIKADRGRLTDTDIERMIADAERYREEDLASTGERVP